MIYFPVKLRKLGEKHVESGKNGLTGEVTGNIISSFWNFLLSHFLRAFFPHNKKQKGQQ